MKTIKDYEKEFDEADIYMEGPYGFILDEENVKTYIFQELLPQVLSEIIPEDKNEYDDFNSGYNLSISRIKQKAKEMGINLPE